MADITVTDGAPMLRSENARPNTWVYIDVRGRDLAATVTDLQTAIAQQLTPQQGVSLTYAGQFEFMERANARLQLVVPGTLLIIFILLVLAFNRLDEALLIMLTLPFALTGGIWLLYLMGYNFSIATGVGFIALAGVSAEFGILMLIYLKQAWQSRIDAGDRSEKALLDAIDQGAVMRVRPKIMTVATIIAGLLPIVWGSGTGAEIMSRIAVPMVGGMISAPLLSLLVLPAAYRLLRQRDVHANH